MNNKIAKISAIALMIIVSGMLLMSAFFKFTGAEEVVSGLTAIGLGSYVSVLGVIELVSAILFLIPASRRVGFLLICSYLGGAASIELAGGVFPVALVFIALAWSSVFLWKRSVFLPEQTTIRSHS